MYNRFAIAACAAILVSPCVSLAADDLAAVVVTATRFEEPLNAATGIDKTIISGSEIRKSGIRSVADALERFGNVQVRNDFFGAGNRTIDARGFGDTASSNTLILLDGVRISENEGTNAFTSGIPVEQIERIEILRGGAGAVAYGEGTTGGTINIITRHPLPGEKSARLSLAAGSYGTQDVAAGGTLGGETWSVFANSNQHESANFRRNNEAKNRTLTAGARGYFSQGEIGFSATDEHSQARLPGSLTIAQFQADPRQTTNPDDWSDTGIQRQNVFGTLTLGDVDLRADWSDTQRASRFFQWGGLTRIDANSRILSPRARWRPAGANIELVAGSDLSHWDSTRPDNNFFSPGTNRANQDARALYAQTIVMLDQTRLEFGLRHETFDKRNDSATPAYAYQQSQSSAPWNLALRQTFGNHAVFGRIGRSDRVPNVDENNARTDASLLAVQRSRDLEIGAATQFKALGANLRLFRHRVENEVAFDMTTPTCFGPACGFGGANRSLPPTLHQGLELEGRLRASDTLSLSLQYSALKARFVSGMLNGAPVAGNELPLVPSQRFNLRGVWEPLANHRIEAAYQQVSGQRYSGDYNNVINGRIPAYGLWDLGYRFKFKDGDAGITGRNLRDHRYFSVGFGPGGVYPEAGRRLMADLNLRF